MWLQHYVFSTLLSYVICLIVHQFTHLFIHSFFHSFIIYCFIYIYNYYSLDYSLINFLFFSCCCGRSAEGRGCEKRVRIRSYLHFHHSASFGLVGQHQLESYYTQHDGTLLKLAVLHHTTLHHSTLLIRVAISWAISLIEFKWDWIPRQSPPSLLPIISLYTHTHTHLHLHFLSPSPLSQHPR